MFKRQTGVALIAALCSTVALADEVIKIGHAAPLTGPSARVGKDTENGALLAIEDANAKGIKIGGQKVKFELVGVDDQADPRQGVIAAQRLVDMGVKAVIGHQSSGTSIPASKVYNDAGIPQVSPSATNVKLTHQGYKGVFRVVGNDNQQGAALVTYAVKTLKAKTVAVIDDRTAYGQGLADEFEKKVKALGGQVVAREYATDKTTDFMSVLTLVKSRQPDVVMYGGMDATAAPLLVQMRRLGMKSKLVLGDGANSGDMVKLSGDAIDDTVYSSQAAMDKEKMPGAKSLEKRYKARYGIALQAYGYQAYDATNFFIAAMQKAGSTDPKKFLPAMFTTTLNGVTGSIAFNAKGDQKSPAITVYGYERGLTENNGWKASEIVTMQ